MVCLLRPEVWLSREAPPSLLPLRMLEDTVECDVLPDRWRLSADPVVGGGAVLLSRTPEDSVEPGTPAGPLAGAGALVDANRKPLEPRWTMTGGLTEAAASWTSLRNTGTVFFDCCEALQADAGPCRVLSSWSPCANVHPAFRHTRLAR